MAIVRPASAPFQPAPASIRYAILTKKYGLANLMTAQQFRSNQVSDSTNTIETFANQEYKYGFVTDIEADAVPPGLNEDVIRLISAKKDEPEWLLEWRLKAYRHWLTMTEPTWANVHYPPIDYQDIIYYSAPKAEDRRPEEPGRSRPGAAEDLREARHPAAGARAAGRRGGGRGV